jgi:hypothetical protein
VRHQLEWNRSPTSARPEYARVLWSPHRSGSLLGEQEKSLIWLHRRRNIAITLIDPSTSASEPSSTRYICPGASRSAQPVRLTWVPSCTSAEWSSTGIPIGKNRVGPPESIVRLQSSLDHQPRSVRGSRRPIHREYKVPDSGRETPHKLATRLVLPARSPTVA